MKKVFRCGAKHKKAEKVNADFINEFTTMPQSVFEQTWKNKSDAEKKTSVRGRQKKSEFAEVENDLYSGVSTEEIKENSEVENELY